MKKIRIIGLAIAALFVCNAAFGATPAQKLIKRLSKMERHESTAFGHHDDTAYGHEWEYVEDNSDVKLVTGDYPAVMNWDLGLLEWGCEKQLDGVPLEFIKKEIYKQYKRGGINSISWHLRNPVTKGNSWDTSRNDVVKECVTPGTAINDTIREWVASVADFIGDLRDEKGRRIPVIFRPWHEHTGEWFWWGINHCTPEEYKALWHLTREVFDSKGIDNVVWAYSPDKSNVSNDEDYMERYPGDYYVDIMGADVYHFNGDSGNDIFTQWMHQTLGAACRQAKIHKKIAALTETGSEGLKGTDWYTKVLMPAIDGYKIAYITVWRNGYNMENHFYAPYPGHKDVEDFKAYYNSPKSAFLKEVKKIK